MNFSRCYSEAFDPNIIEILVESSEYYRKFIDYCIQNEKVDMLKTINGIVVMDTIFY